MNRPIKLWLDDERPAPPGWIHAHNAAQALELLSQVDVDVMSLGHDLGDADAPTGYDVLSGFEKWVVEFDRPVPIILIHTANPVGRKRMEAARAAIYRQGIRGDLEAHS